MFIEITQYSVPRGDLQGAGSAGECRIWLIERN